MLIKGDARSLDNGTYNPNINDSLLELLGAQVMSSKPETSASGSISWAARVLRRTSWDNIGVI